MVPFRDHWAEFLKYQYVLENPRRVKPISWRGMPGLFTVDAILEVIGD